MVASSLRLLVIVSLASLSQITLGLLPATPVRSTVRSNVRSYGEIERRILSVKGAKSERIGVISDRQATYNSYVVTFPPAEPLSPMDSGRINILLSGGAHGDEPAGVYALLDFLENDAGQFSHGIRFYVLPCLNPSGFETNRAGNGRGENINRHFFEQSRNPEARLVMDWLKKNGVRFAMTLDMHEIPPDWEDEGWKKSDNPRTAYLYETQPDRKTRMGPLMMQGLPRDIEVCNWKSIYGDRAVNGVVSYPEGNGNAVYAQGTTFDAFLFRLYTGHSFTTETPIGWSLEKRVRTQLSWLKSALRKLESLEKRRITEYRS